jgi:glycosyltransferase involved in cell wall biosynthesis
MSARESPLHLVYVSWEFPPEFGGGIGTYVEAISRAMVARGHEVTVVTLGSRDWPVRELRHGVRVVRLRLPRGHGDGEVGALNTWNARGRSLAEFLPGLCRRGVDIIEFADYRGEGLAYLTEVTARPLTIARLHSPLSVLRAYLPGHERRAALEEYEHRTILACDRIVSPSRVLAEAMPKNLDRPVTIDLSPHPADAFYLERAPLDTSPQCRDVLCVGRLDECKGVHTLAAAAPAFLDACPQARLVLVGNDTAPSPDMPSMKRRIERMIPSRLADRFVVLAPRPREQLLDLYRDARLCVLPSHYDNFPNTCLEAMAMQKFVIGTRNSGMAEMIEDGVSGRVIPSADAAALSAALIEAFNMPHAARKTMAQAARRRVEQRYAPAVIAEETERLYRGYLAQRGAPRVQRPVRTGTLKVAVVIPCFNHGEFLPDALASVKAQTHPGVECVIVDDGSTQPATIAALDAAREEGWRVLRQENAGLAEARNAGVRATDAEFFVPLDADDRLDPRFIEQLLPPLLADAGLGFSYGRVTLFGAENRVWECPKYDPRRLLTENLSCATAVVRREAFDEAGGYAADMTFGFEDWDFWIALLALGWHGRMTPEPLFFYRRHAGGSMLARAEPHREEMVNRIIEHHAGLLAAVLGQEAPLAAGDWGRTAHLYRSLLAEAEVARIENSRLWRLVRRIARLPGAGGLLASVELNGAAHERLAGIRKSPAFRLITAFKNLPLYRWYAQRKYGT